MNTKNIQYKTRRGYKLPFEDPTGFSLLSAVAAASDPLPNSDTRGGAVTVKFNLVCEEGRRTKRMCLENCAISD